MKKNSNKFEIFRINNIKCYGFLVEGIDIYLCSWEILFIK